MKLICYYFIDACSFANNQIISNLFLKQSLPNSIVISNNSFSTYSKKSEPFSLLFSIYYLYLCNDTLKVSFLYLVCPSQKQRNFKRYGTNQTDLRMFNKLRYGTRLVPIVSGCSLHHEKSRTEQGTFFISCVPLTQIDTYFLNINYYGRK